MRRWVAVMLSVLVLSGSPFSAERVDARNSANAPASMLRYPLIHLDDSVGVDTLVTLTNTGFEPVRVRCFYEDATPRCDGEGVCVPDGMACEGTCQQHFETIEFFVSLTPRQPTGWQVSAGRSEFPVGDGEGPGGSSNLGSRVPPLGRGPFIGALMCYTIGPDQDPIAADVLIGSALVETERDDAAADIAAYDAFGLGSTESGPDADLGLLLGGQDAELAGCPGATSLPFFFDFATLESPAGETSVTTDLVISPCSVDLQGEGTGSASVVQFLIYNEFGQRFSTSRTVDGHFFQPLHTFDTAIPQRSIFAVTTAGTLTGHLTVQHIGGGATTLALERHESMEGSVSTAVYAPSIGRSPLESDLVVLPAAVCLGDCNGDGRVAVNELVTGVGIALQTKPIDVCSSFDRDHNGAVAVPELISGVRNALDGCPSVPQVATVENVAGTVLPNPSDGPEIAYFGTVTANGFVQESIGVDEVGRPIFEQPFGQGFSIVIEVRPGLSGRIGTSAFSEVGALPGLQVILSRSIGDGSVAVCDVGSPREASGGVPAKVPFSFDDTQDLRDAVNDLGCRFDNGNGEPMARGRGFNCTRSDTPGRTDAVSSVGSDIRQFCLPVARGWSFPTGDTVVAARGQDDGGNAGAADEIVVRVVDRGR